MFKYRKKENNEERIVRAGKKIRNKLFLNEALEKTKSKYIWF